MKVWIPTKAQIEQMLQDLHDKVRNADKIKDIEEEITDDLSELECHIYNRALEEDK